MYKIVRKKALNPTVTQMEIEAPLVAKKAKPGQFIILRVDAEGERILPADTVVMAAGAKPNTDMYEQLKEHFEHVDLIGDAVKVAKIPDAISSGYYLGISF